MLANRVPTRVRPCRRPPARTRRRCSSSSINWSPRRCCPATRCRWSSRSRALRVIVDGGRGTGVRRAGRGARARFVQELEGLKEGESAAPYVENFLPAVLPAVRIATRLIGRPKIVGFLAGILGKLISKLVGPQQRAGAVARHRRRRAEAGQPRGREDQEHPRIAASAVAATVEETLAASRRFRIMCSTTRSCSRDSRSRPSSRPRRRTCRRCFSDATYRKRPDLLEGGVNAAWVMLPARRPRYKRCSRTFNVTITPQMAEAIESFEGAPLSEYFQDQLGMAEGEDVEAEVHLYEVVAGGTAADIARSEDGNAGARLGRRSRGLAAPAADAGSRRGAARQARSRPHGCRPARTCAGWRPGQRVFHMVVGRRPLTVPGRRPAAACAGWRGSTSTLDSSRDEVRVCVYFSEVKAQRLAVRLRQQSHAGSLAVAFTRCSPARLPPILHGRGRAGSASCTRALPPGGIGAALAQLPAVVPPVFVAKMQEWLVAAFAEFVKTQGAEVPRRRRRSGRRRHADLHHRPSRRG